MDASLIHSRALNNEINRFDERALRIVYSDYNSSFNTLLEKDGFYRNIQILTIMGDAQKLNSPVTYNLRARKEMYGKNPKTIKYGKETTSFLTQKIWPVFSQNIKNCVLLSSFKINIRKWKGADPYR